MPVTGNNKDKPERLKCPCCGGVVSFSHHEDLAGRRRVFSLHHPSRQVALSGKAPSCYSLGHVDYALERNEKLTTPSLGAQFAIDDYEMDLSLKSLGKHINSRTQIALKDIGLKCSAATQGKLEPEKPKIEPALTTFQHAYLQAYWGDTNPHFAGLLHPDEFTSAPAKKTAPAPVASKAAPIAPRPFGTSHRKLLV